MATGAGSSLEEVLEDTPPEKLDVPCRDKHLCDIARHITDWPALAPIMGVRKTEEEEIEGRWPKSIKRQKIELLRKWKHKNRSKRQGRWRNTYRCLCKAFMKAQEVALAEKVCAILYDEGSSPESSSDTDESEEPRVAEEKSQRENSPSLLDGDSTKPNPLPEAETSNADPLEPLAKCLRMTYGSYTPSFAVFQWPPPPTLKVFNLAMILSHETVRRKPLDENLVRLTLRGNVVDIMEKKTSIHMVDLFTTHHETKERKVILIEGAPGAGKSTLAWHICQKWKLQESFHRDFQVVIYVQLGEQEVQSAKEMADLLPMELETDRKDAASLIRDCHGERVLFVLDGWDEFSAGLQRGSFFEKLICRPEKLSVQRSTVLIMSRPIAAGPLQKHATSRVEIVGFTPVEVDRYFTDVLKDPLTVHQLHEHLKERPLIKASCYLPLNAAIVAHLFIELNHTLPTSRNGVFSSLVLSCIIRHLTKEYEKEPEISSLDELPPHVQEVFLKVCLLAYEGTMRNKVIFSGQDLQSYGLPQDLNVLSLMQVVQRFSTGRPTSYHFLHLSIQELLAALHISKLPPTEQVRILNELFNQPRFEAVFGFYAVITKLQAKEVRDFFARVVQDVVHNQSKSGPSKSSLQPLLNVMRCVHEAQDPSLCRLVSSQLNGTLDFSSRSLSPVDLLALRYLLSCVNSSGSGSGVNDHSARNRTVDELNLSFCDLTTKDINSLSLRNLLRLNLRNNRVSFTCAARLLTNSPQLTVLQLCDCALSDEGVELFAAALRQHQSLKVLNLSLNGPTSYWTSQILTAIHQHHSLQHLDLEDCEVDIKEVAAAIETNVSLRELIVLGDDRTDDDLRTLSYSLKKNRTLHTLSMIPTMVSNCSNVMLSSPIAIFSSNDELLYPEMFSDDGLQEFVGSLRDCHLQRLIMTTSKPVPVQWVDRVNEVRRTRCLPTLHLDEAY